MAGKFLGGSVTVADERIVLHLQPSAQVPSSSTVVKERVQYKCAKPTNPCHWPRASVASSLRPSRRCRRYSLKSFNKLKLCSSHDPLFCRIFLKSVFFQGNAALTFVCEDIEPPATPSMYRIGAQPPQPVVEKADVCQTSSRGSLVSLEYHIIFQDRRAATLLLEGFKDRADGMPYALYILQTPSPKHTDQVKCRDA